MKHIFPQFIKIEPRHKQEIESYTLHFPPYSDFNFISLISWDIDDLTKFSTHQGNLIIELSDYLTGEIVYTFIGKENVWLTAKTLLDYSKEKTGKGQLKLIPQIIVDNLNNSNHNANVQEDRDSFDYILSVEDLISLKGKAFRGKKNFLNRFNKNYASITSVSEIDIADKYIQNKIVNLFTIWADKANKDQSETTNEFKAINRLFRNASNFDLLSIGIFIDGKLCGFSINETVQDSYSIIHFEKADVSYIGIYQFLKNETAKLLHKKGVAFINYEQDLGIEGLKKSKSNWHPVTFIKKYIISSYE